MNLRRVLAVVCSVAVLLAPGMVSAQTFGASERRGTGDFVVLTGDAVQASITPAGFSDVVVGNVQLPTGVVWTPDGRMLVISKAGRVLVVKAGRPNQVALDISGRVCDESELGLVGIAVDPEFRSNRFVYLYYTRGGDAACVERAGRNFPNRVGRFVLGDDNRISAASEQVIIDHIASAGAHHVAGDLEFGEDGYLYVAVGDGICTVRGTERCGSLNTNSQDLAVPHGKILRVGRGGIPAATNPYVDASGARRCTNPVGVPSGTGPCKEIFASGFRNPFRFARKPGTNRFFVNDVGLDTWEEVNRLAKGKNYGWNAREGFCVRGSKINCDPVAKYTDPIHAYLHADNCRSITGGAFVPNGLWPGFEGAYLFADYACGKVWRLDQSAGGFKRSLFMSGTQGPTHLRFGPHGSGQALYYLSIFTGTVHRVTTTTQNTPPTAEFSYVPDGRQVYFDGAGSTDGDSGDRVVEWTWDFGDGTGRLTTTTPAVDHTYTATGPFQVSLTVTDTHGSSSAPFSMTVHSGEHAPVVDITTPAETARFTVGQPLTLKATATDSEDGPLPASSITWTVLRQHANHVHPYHGPVTGASTTINYPEPENLAAAADSFLRAYATATDSKGHATTVTQALRPLKVQLQFATVPQGGRVALEGTRYRTPKAVTSWAGHVFLVGVPDQRIDGKAYVFKSWSDGGARRHDIVTPTTPTNYVATLRPK